MNQYKNLRSVFEMRMVPNSISCCCCCWRLAIAS